MAEETIEIVDNSITVNSIWKSKSNNKFYIVVKDYYVRLSGNKHVRIIDLALLNKSDEVLSIEASILRREYSFISNIGSTDEIVNNDNGLKTFMVFYVKDYRIKQGCLDYFIIRASSKENAIKRLNVMDDKHISEDNTIIVSCCNESSGFIKMF